MEKEIVHHDDRCNICPKEIGYYDDSCRQCGKEQTVSIYTLEQQIWHCHYCEWANPVAEEE